jgi:hypothetical protein
MVYFAKFPSINYSYTAEEDIKTSVDILKRIGIRENIKNDFAVWEKYTVVDGEKPETLAHKLYGSSTLHWVVLMMNEMIDPYHEWPMSSNQLDRMIEKEYSGQAYFVDPTTLKGQFTVGETITQGAKTAKILKWDNSLHKLVVTDISNAFSASVEISSGETTAILKRIVLQNKSALHHFENSDGIYLEPYDNIQTYIGGGNTNVKTNFDYELEKNDARREIKLLQPSKLKPLLREMNSVLKSHRRR